ncbi:MAG: bifunctional nuclease family protein [Desulfoplanes sp.]|nr:bifunctional nuclease family protein [Desulfoplanes sp.]
MVEMTVFGLALDEESQMPILILKDKNDAYVLPIWIGAMEAMAISMGINNVKVPRPMTHDLILDVIRQMGGELLRIEILSIDKGTYYASLVVKMADKTIHIDSRPSDSIALALRCGVPILADEIMLKKAISQQKGEYQAVIEGEDAKKWTEMLSKYKLDDSKYTM